MFTGIIAEQGHVLSVDRDGDTSATVRLHAPGTTEGLGLGGSIAVNGVCLTATEINGKEFSVDVMGETLVRTTIGELASGDSVNLERCVPAGGRLDGHVVQGHVDGVGRLLEREALGNWERLRFGVPANLARYIAEKGSIAIDGVSLTVTAVSPAPEPEPWFEVGLIPTTLAETGLGAKTEGSRVNLEVDVLAKYTERLLAFSAGAASSVTSGTSAASSVSASSSTVTSTAGGAR
ncbi:riboflavin synthase [Arthrobacter sp. CDRTa11]|uniref:riboflavin synthase n=1 Tax=Arthrobacter sp. CDRTa11 TaxID=2651199 RepID=UPI002265B36D|nr:riboflavin synthase [Arthrobacter sp. CDRTa11]UZX02768.1 riboflavin synthase [Arthrobacter sp. CDRTa11]